MNFAGRKFKYVNNTAEDLTPREKRLLAENNKLKKRNKRLSTAMLFLVDQVEARLPFLNGPTPAKTTKTPSNAPYQPNGDSKKPSLAERVESRSEAAQSPKTPAEKPAPVASRRPKEVKPQIIGTAWTPEKLEPARKAPAEPKPTRPLSIQEVFAEKKKDRDGAEQIDDGVTIPEIPEAAAPPPPDATESALEPAQAEPQADAPHTPDLAPEEMDILAAPTRDKETNTGIASSELIKARKEETKSAAEASMAYRAVSTVSRPVPEDDLKLVEDSDDVIIDQKDTPTLAARAAQHNVMREAMLRRVNRLRW
ncbi:MAG: hypothetical protein JJ879_03925 [Sneathiella sp.]|nr:hypothetical protein [Sneathiella sp.]